MNTHRLPFVPLQSEPAECGIVAISAFSALHGQPLCAHHLKSHYGVSTRGSSVSQLLKILRDAGYEANAALIDRERPEAISAPVIALWEDKHFVVVRPLPRSAFDVFDPESGWTTISTAELQEALSGLVIEARPASSIPSFPLRTPFPLWRWLKRFQFAKPLAVIGAVALIAQLSAISLPLLSKDLVDRTLHPSQGDLTTYAILAYGAVGLVGLLLSSLMARLTSRLSNHLTFCLTLDISRRVLGLSLDVLMRNAPSALYGKVQTVQSIQHLLLSSITGALVTGMVGLTAVVLLVMLSPQLGAVILFLRVLIIAFDRSGRIRTTRINERRHRLVVHQMALVVETIRAAAPLRAAGAMGRSIEKIRNDTRKLVNTQIEQNAAEQGRIDSSAAIGLLDQLIYLGLGTSLVAAGTMSFGTFVAVGLYRQFAAAGFSEIQKFLSARLTARVALGRLEGIVDPDLPAPSFAPSTPAELNDASIQVSDLSFRYSSFDAPIFESINLDIKSGECIALVGASGSGKSTLAKLMTAMLRPTTGSIRIGGVELDEGSQDSILPHLATVMQNDSLISASVRDNIQFYRDISDEAIEYAAKQACIHDFIMSLPMRYLTPISDEYNVISGGQRQRIILARAIASKPRVLVMDEATSALDPPTERLISANIRQMTMTRVIFAHRQETIRSADRVVDMASLNNNGAYTECA